MLEDESDLSLISLMGRSWAPIWCTLTITYNPHWEKLSATAGINDMNLVCFCGETQHSELGKVLSYPCV